MSEAPYELMRTSGEQQEPTSSPTLSWLVVAWQQLIAVLGWGCIILGIAGAILPILPAWPFLLPGIILLGPRNRRLRLYASRLRLALRRGSRHDHAFVRGVSRIFAEQERALRKMLGPLLSRWAASSSSVGPLRYLVLLLPPLAIAFTVFLVVQLLKALG
jgi:hypothetical protein